MTKNRHFIKSLCLILALVLAVGLVSAPALADYITDTTTAAAASPEPGTVMTEYNDTDGHALAPSATATGDMLAAQAIPNYVYTGYTATVNDVYSRDHLQYIIGYTDHSVRPERDLSRAEATMIFYRISLYYSVYNPSYAPKDTEFNVNTFSDVTDPNAWYYPAIQYMYDCGKIAGYTDGTFKPDQPITRAEFAVMAANFEGKLGNDANTFSDVPLGYWAEPYINAAATEGWVVGYPDGTFRPEQNITRAETVTLINNVLGQHVTVDKLTELDVVNPYNDIVSEHWAYADMMEASIPHDTVTWHGTIYNDGATDQLTEIYVDQDGNQIAPPVVTSLTHDPNPKAFDGYVYWGAIKTITYQYTDGSVIPSVTKTPDKTTVSVGDRVNYTIALADDARATEDWQNVILTDPIDTDHYAFIDGSVEIGGSTVPYTYENGLLTVDVGDVAVGATANLTYGVTVLDTAYGKSIDNTAWAASGNYETISGVAPSVQVNQGIISPYVTKSVNRTTASVGDIITYTVTAGNGGTATYPWTGVVITDAIPGGLTFIPGSVEINGQSADYAYQGGVLAVNAGDIAPGSEAAITFQSTVNSIAYNTAITNTAVGTGINTTDNYPASDKGVEIKPGVAVPAFTKSADKATAKVGDSLVYTFTAGNDKHATADWQGVVISDVIPAGLIFTPGSVEINGSATTNYAYDPAVGLLTINLGNVAPGKTDTATLQAVVNASAYDTTITNTAVAKSNNAPDQTASGQSTTIGAGEADPSLVKKVSKSSAVVGDTLVYTITAGNGVHATSAWHNVVVTDVIPSYLNYVAGTVEVNGVGYNNIAYDPATSTLTVYLTDIVPGTAEAITFDAIINNTAYGQQFMNTAIAASDNAPNQTATDGGVTVTPGTDYFSTAKSVDKTTANVGDIVKYTITANNSHKATKDVTGVVITDTLDPGLTFNAGSVQINGIATTNYGFTDGVLTINIGNIAPDTSDVVTFTCLVNHDAMNKTIHNVAAVSSTSDPAQTPKSPDIAVGGGAAMGTVVKLVDKSEASVGETLTYTIAATASPLSTDAWKGVVVTDPIPQGLTYVEGSVSTFQGQTLVSTPANYNTASRILTVNLGDIAPGTTAHMTFKATVDAGMQGQHVYNTAVVQGADGVQYPCQDSGTDIDSGNVAPIITKSSTPSAVNIGDTVHYTITVQNSPNDTVNWRNVVVNDTIPAGLSFAGNVYVNTHSAQYSKSGNTLNIPLGSVAPGATAVVTFDCTANTAGSYENTAIASSDNHPDVSASDDGVTVTAPAPVGETNTHPTYGFIATKTPDKTQVTVGDMVTYTVTLTNPADSAHTWYDVVINDPFNLVNMVPDLSTVQINGVPSQAQASYDTELHIKVGNLNPGVTDVITFAARAKSDGVGQAVTNVAYNDGYIDTAHTTAADVIATAAPVMIDDSVPPATVTDEHIQLYQGFADGTWRPNDYLTMSNAALLFYRIALASQLDSPADKGPVNDVTPDQYFYIAVKYFYNENALAPDANMNLNPNDPVTMAQLVAMANVVGLGPEMSVGGYTASQNPITRIATATMMCKVLGRDTTPDTNGLPLPTFTDVSNSLTDAQYQLIVEVSTKHQEVATGSGSEQWVNSTWNSTNIYF